MAELMDPEALILTLGLVPHPEGGHYAETYRTAGPGRAHGTAIYFLLRAGERSHWHRIDADEIWHFYAGAPLELEIAAPGCSKSTSVLGPNLALDQRPQRLVPKGHWQAAQSLGAWTLVGCTVTPGFEFSGFELAAPGFEPGPDDRP